MTLNLKLNIQIILTFLPNRGFLRSLSLSLEDISKYTNILFINPLEHMEIIKLLKKSDCLLFLSEQESLGLPIVEAILNKVPVIAPKLPYASELLGLDYPYLFASSNNQETRNDLIRIIKKFVFDLNNKKVKSHKKLYLSSIDDLVDLIFAQFINNK